MSSPLQLGDIVTIANLAKQLFEFGWARRYSSCRNYNEFGRDVDALRYNLDILSAVIQGADSQLQARSRTTALRWDPRSFEQIIGDCWTTIRECQELLRDNRSFAVDAGPLQNIKWNVMVQDDVDALQFRIQQHTAKIQLAMTPFEIDLLTSIQRSIDDMHASIQNSIREVRRDVQDVRRDVHEVLRLQGVVVPELQQGLDRQEAQTPLLVVPTDIRDKLDHMYNRTTTRSPSLTDLADAFVTHFHESTYVFEPASRIASDKVPPDKAYLNLMKCIWLMEKVKETEEFRNIAEESHWPSYVAELEKVLSDECHRFEGDLVTPTQLTLSDEYLRIWRKENRSSTVIIPREAEVVLSTRVSRRSDEGEQQELKLQLLRYLDEVNGQEFTINIYGETEGSPLSDSHDFNLKTAVLIPRYVVGDLGTGLQRLPEPPRLRGLWPNRTFRNIENDRPSSNLSQQSQGSYKVTLGRGRKFETFNFKRLKDAMAFQHAITGYYVQGPKSFTAHATFVFSNQGSHRYKAYVQVWYPLRKDADLSATANLASGSTTPTERVNSFQFACSPRSSTTTFNYHIRGGVSPDFRNPFSQPRRDTRDTFRTGADLRPSRQTSLNTINSTEVSRSPPGLGAFNLGRVSEQYGSPENILPPRVPNDAYDGSEERHMSLSQRSQVSSRRTSIFSTIRSRTRSSITSHWTEHSSSSNSSGGGSSSTIGVDTGGGIIGTLHTPPSKPMIVILIDDQDTGERSIVTLDLPTSEVRPDLCDCRRGDEKGRRCRDVCLEFSRQGTGGSRRSFLQARVLKPTTAQSVDWDLSRLAYTRRNDDSVDSSPLENLNRVTISFDSASDRKTFSGDLACGCANRGKAGLETDRQRRDCAKEGHRGIVGQAKEYYWRELRAYETAEASRTHVVHGPRPND